MLVKKVGEGTSGDIQGIRNTQDIHIRIIQGFREHTMQTHNQHSNDHTQATKTHGDENFAVIAWRSWSLAEATIEFNSGLEAEGEWVACMARVNESKRGKLWTCLEVHLAVYMQRWGGRRTGNVFLRVRNGHVATGALRFCEEAQGRQMFCEVL